MTVCTKAASKLSFLRNITYGPTTVTDLSRPTADFVGYNAQ